MIFSKIWLLVVSTVAGVLLTLTLLTPRVAAVDLDREIGGKLERAYHAASQVLKVNARQWIDSVARLSADAVLIEALDQASRTPPDPSLLHKTVQDRLKTFNESMKVGLLWATDVHGKVIARVGLDEEVYKDGIDGFPLVSDALRGIRSDDTWALGGKLYRVAASPVVTREKYVGALIIGQEVSTELARSMKQLLDLDVAFLLDGKVIAASTQLPILPGLPKLAESYLKTLKLDERTAPLRLDEGGSTYLTVLGPFVGEAADQHAGFAVIAPRATPLSISALISRAASDEHLGRILLPLGALVAVFFVIGWLLHLFEHDAQLRHLRRDARAVEIGDSPRLNAGRLRGDLSHAAISINNVLDRALSSSASMRSPWARSQGEDSRPQPPKAEKSERKKIERNNRPTLPERPLNERPSVGSESATVAANAAPSEPGVELAPMNPEDLMSPKQALGLEHEPTALAQLPDEDTDRPQYDSPDYVDGGAVSILGPSSSGMGIDDGATTLSPFGGLLNRDRPEPLPVPAAAAPDPLDDELRGVFAEFLETKQRCGEATEGLNFEKFVEKLRANREQLLARNPGKAVRFAVYVKDGKAALKASLS